METQVMIGHLRNPIAGSVVQIAARALVYLLGRLRDIIIDRLLEALIIALVALMAGVSWFGDVPAILDKILG